MYTKIGASAQKEIKQELSCKKSVTKDGIQLAISVGDSIKCPECKTIGRVVWVSQDKKTMGVQCPGSHGEMKKPESRFGAHAVPSTKTRKNVVFLTKMG